LKGFGASFLVSEPGLWSKLSCFRAFFLEITSIGKSDDYATAIKPLRGGRVG